MAFMTTIQKSNFLQSKAIKVVMTIVVLATLIGAGYFAYSRFASQGSTSTTDETALQTAKATRGDLVLFADGTGTIIPAAEASLGFGTSGQVSEIGVQVGDQVEAGQVLAKLDDSEEQVALAEAEQTLGDAKTSVDTTKEVLAYLISPEVLYWEEKVAEREQALAEAQAAAQTDTSE